MIYIIIRLYLRFEGTLRMGMGSGDENGPPNDTSGVIWDLGASLFFLCVFYLLTNDLHYN